MRLIRPCFTILLLVLMLRTIGQDYNPYKSIGKKAKILTAYGGKFVEVFDYDSVQRIGSVLFNTRTKRIVRLLSSEQTYRKYSNNSAASRWYSPDPLASKFHEWSPYVFVADNPIRFNDPDGKELIDQNGKRIAVTFNKDGSLKFSKNANADLVRIANGMAKTGTGLKILHAMNDSKTMISLTIDKEHVVKESNGAFRIGVTEPTISQMTVNGKPVGEKSISVAKITLYEASLKESLTEGQGQTVINGTTIDTKNSSITQEDILASYGVHEGTHATDRGSSSSLNPHAPAGQTERKPYANQLQYLKELEENNSNNNNNP